MMFFIDALDKYLILLLFWEMYADFKPSKQKLFKKRANETNLRSPQFRLKSCAFSVF